MDLEKRMDRVEKNLDTTAKLVKLGMKVVLQNARDTKEAINALIDAQMRAEARMDRTEARQRRSDEKFERLIASLLGKGRNGGNGRKR